MTLKFMGRALALASFGLCATTALAGTAPRAWVSGKGTDTAGCGAPTAACRSLQYAHDNIVADGGEIDFLDPAGYGAITITKSLSIVNDGVGTAGVQQDTAAQDAITVNAGGGSVTLRGLNIDGLGAARDGIRVNSAAAITVINCVARHFTHDGFYVRATTLLSLSVLDTIASDNTNDGFDISPTGAGSTLGFIDRSAAFNNGSHGVSVFCANSSSGYAIVNVTNTNTSNNTGNGVYAYTSAARLGNTEVDLFNDTSNFNLNGYYQDGSSAMVISRSQAMWNQHTVMTINAGVIGWSTGDNEWGARGGITGTLNNLGRF